MGLEECDDGNVIDGDGCDSSCRVEPGKNMLLKSEVSQYPSLFIFVLGFRIVGI